MDSIFEKNLITTKDAGELSGYSSDYLARLARSGKIEGKRIGHSWLIDKDSLAHFIDQQGDRKIDYARALARTRETEYRKHNSLLHNAAETLSKPITVPQTNILGSIVHSQAFALSVAGIVVVSGAFAANAAAFPQIANQALAIAHEAAFGFNETFGNIPSNIASRINATTEKINTISPRVAENTKSSSANIATSLPVVENLSSLRLATTKNPNTVHSYQPTGIISPTHATESAITIADIQSFARTLCTFVLNPSHAVGSLSDAYTTIGLRSYAAISTSLSSYRSLIELSGINSLKLASYTRDSISASPLLVSKINLALGNAIINGTHAAIRADVATAYGISTAVPNGGRAVIALVVGTGNLLANSTARTPALATALYLHTTEIPAKAGPALARAVFNVEYGVSARFVKDTNAVSGSYALALRSLGEAGYSGTTGTLALIQEVRHRQQLWMSDFHNIPIALQDAYLGALGKSALAIDSIIRIPQVATVISASSPSTKTVLVLGKQVALITYKTINDLFNSATRTLATLFVQPTPIVAPTIQKTRTITVAPTTTYNLRPSTSYPTYTTVINGISDDFLNQSLASLRTNILATVENISYKVEKNSSYLTSLIVKNGDFRGGVFDKGTMTNGISVSATTGTFTNLTAQTTSLATTTITGDLSVSGTITPEIVSAGTSISAPYFTATSTTNNTFPNLIATSATTTNSTSTNLYSSSLIAGNATSTNFFATLGHFTTGIVDTFSSTLATIIGATFTNSTTTNATTTGSFALTSATPSRFLSLTSNGVATSTNLSSWLAGTTNQITMTDNGTGGLTASLPSLVALNNASSSQFSAFQKSYFGATATSTFDSAGVLTLASALAVTSGGTGWSAIQSGAIPYGNDAGAVSTTTTATNGNILAWLNNIPTPLATSTISTGSGISVSGTGALVNAGGLTITNTGVLSLQQLGGGTAQTGALTFATSTVTTNGQTLGIAVTNSSGAFTFTPTISGTLDNSGLTNSTIALSDSNSTLTIGGTPASLGGTLTATLNLAHSNIWTALQSFANASTSQLSVFNKAYFGGTATSTFDSAGALTLITPLLVSSGGTGQTSFTSGNLLYGAGTGAIQNVATTTIAVGTGISVTSGTLGYQIGGANVTLGIASNALTLAQLPQINSGYILGNNTGTTGNVTSFATSTLFGTGTGGQILAWNNGVPQFIATTTIPVGGNISGTLSNLTVVTNANLSGAISSVGNTTSLSSFTSANLSGALTDETGSGSAVFSASPTFTGISTFANASTTLFSSYGPAYFGATATSTFSSAGVLTLASALSVANGGMGTTTWQTNSIPYFNGTYFTSNNPNLNFNGTTLSAANISTGGTLNVTGVTTLATSLSGLLGANAGGVYSIATSSPLNTSITGNAATVTTNANLTGVVTSSGNATSYAATAGANTILGNGTGTTGAPTFIATSTLFSWNGTGLVVRDTSPTFTTPNLGTPSALVLTNATGLPVAGGGTGAATLTGLLQGNGTSAITGITGTAGQFPYYNGASTLLATSTIFLATSGNVGIGTTTPDYKLSVVNSSDIYSKVGLDPLTQYFGKVQFGTAGSYIGYDYTGNERMVLNSRYANSHYEFQIAGSEKVRIDNSGNVGIGTTSPSALLAVQGNSYVSGTGFFGGAITSTSTLAISGTGNSYILGNVGIGTSVPNTSLNVNVKSATTGIRISNFMNGVATEGFDLNYSTNGSTNAYIDSRYPISDAAMNFRMQTGGATPVSAMTILGNGNVGIGTTNPVALLQVGTAAGTFGGSNTGLVGIITGVNTAATSPSGNLRVMTTDSQAADVGGSIALGGLYSGADNFSFANIAGRKENGTNANPAGYLQLTTTNAAGAVTEQMRITSTGKVGIGTANPATKLEVGGTTSNVTLDGYLNCTVFTTNANGLLDCTRSDERVKQDITQLDAMSSLAAINALNPVSFNWRDPSMGTGQQFGLIAQQVRNVFPNLVQTTNPTPLTPDGTLVVNYYGLIAPMIRSIQELDANMKQLQAAGAILSVEAGTDAQCVTGDTKLRRRRKNSGGGFEFDEIAIADVAVGDEIASLDETSGRVVYSRVNALLDMGVQEIFELKTASGRTIRTTGNHPYLVRERATLS